MDFVYIFNAHTNDGYIQSFLCLPHEIESALFTWSYECNYACCIYAYRIGSLSQDSFMAWRAHNLTEFDIVQFEFEHDVSLFN